MGVEVELQRALYTRLNGASIGADVFDIAPQAANGGDLSAFPFVTIGRIIITEWDTQTKLGVSALCRIHTWSRTATLLECKTVQGAIYTALHRQELTVTGFANVSLLREDTDCFPEQDGRVHGVCEYRALIEAS